MPGPAKAARALPCPFVALCRDHFAEHPLDDADLLVAVGEFWAVKGSVDLQPHAWARPADLHDVAL
jgi:hypothetical protein